MVAQKCTFIYDLEGWFGNFSSFLLLFVVSYGWYLKNSGPVEIDGIMNKLEFEMEVVYSWIFSSSQEDL